ncbi:MAG: Crp/Fnr family transcriptional regulator [Bacteroidota bacterium]
MSSPELASFLSAIYPLPPALLQRLCSIWVPVSEKRKTVLTRAGEVERHLYFVLDGVQRVYYFDEQDREATIIFSYPPSFSGVADSFLTQTPSRFYAETLTPSSLLRTSFHELNQLMQEHHEIEHLIRTGTNFALQGVLERMVEIQCFSAEEKFRTLMKRSPHLLNLVPHKYLASYLGMDATNFSKLVTRVRI